MTHRTHSWTLYRLACLGVVLGACFGGEFVQGLPCTSDADCGPQLQCLEGACGGLGDLALCGNGLRERGEACDDGNLEDGDACTPSCRLPACGDGYQAPDEACDDGNVIDGDGCSATCTICGDGLLAGDEECDDGNHAAGDFCTPACRLPVCGDGYIGPSEECDDGNDLGTDTCTPTCRQPGCGDGFVNGAGEFCDDGNTIENDACTTACSESPEPPVLELSYAQVKQFELHWQPALGADYYQLFERVDSESEFVQVGDDIVGESLSLTVPLYLRAHASYQLRACNALRCVDSQVEDVVGNLAEAIGYFKPSNGSGAFGRSVAISTDGHTLAVGGAGVFLFARVGASWSEQAHVEPINGGEADNFGYSVALSGDGNTLVVGAPGEDSSAIGIDGDETDDSLVDAGAVYVFTRAGETWVQQAYIKASNTGAHDDFGWSVALSSDGDSLAVGAPGEAGGATGVNGAQDSDVSPDAGAVYIFARTADAWSQTAYIKASNTDPGDRFGTSAALAGDGQTLVAGAPLEDSMATEINGPQDNFILGEDIDIGAAYVFARSGQDWSQQAYIKASNTFIWDRVGYSVALSGSGNILAVGASGDGFTQQGAGRVFARTGSTWVQQASFKPVGSPVDSFVISEFLGPYVAVTTAGDMLAMGFTTETGGEIGITSESNNDAVVRNAGAVFILEAAEGAWPERAYVKASNTWQDYRFGIVALSGDGQTLAVGAPGEASSATGVGGPQNDDSAPGAGAVYVY